MAGKWCPPECKRHRDGKKPAGGVKEVVRIRREAREDTAAEIGLPGLSDRYTATKRIDETGTHSERAISFNNFHTKSTKSCFFVRSTCQRA